MFTRILLSGVYCGNVILMYQLKRSGRAAVFALFAYCCFSYCWCHCCCFQFICVVADCVPVIESSYG